MPIRTRAAIVRDPSSGRFEVTDVTLDDPRQGELLVKLAYSGLCHSDHHLVSGDSPPMHVPMVGGHEGSGVVEAVGPNTPGWEVGDRVVFSFVATCGECRWCNVGLTNLCQLGAHLLVGSRFREPDTFRFALDDGTPVGQMCGVGSFAERTVVDVGSAVKLPPDAPLESVWMLGCGVGTGWGSAVNSAGTRPGDVVIVMGVGGVGVHAVQGAKHAGAMAVIAVDPVEFKRETALKVGATHAFATMVEAADFARTITDWQGADAAVVTVGVVTGEHVAEAFDAVRKAGTVVVTSIAANDVVGIPVPLAALAAMQKRIQGALYGAGNPKADIVRQYDMYRAGMIELDALITNRYELDRVNEGYDDLLAGRNIRGAIVH